MTSHIEAVIDHIETATVSVSSAKAHIEAVTSHIEALTVNTHPFEPTATVHEKMRGHFYSKWSFLSRI